MKKFKAFLILIIILNVSALILTGCGDSDDNGGTTTPSITLSGVASKGLVKNGNVEVFALDPNGDTGESLGTAVTDSNGEYSINLGTYRGNVMVEITGGTYTDEATGDPNVTSIPMRAVLADVSGNVSVAVTPLTEIAYQSATASGKKPTKANITAANALVSTMVGINIINTMPVDATSTPGTSVTDAQKNYGLMLATLSQMVKNDKASDPNSNISKMIASISTDLADETLDTVGNDMKTALTDFIADPNHNKSGIDDPSQTGLDETIDYGTDNPIYDPNSSVNESDVDLAKDMMEDLRNTALSIYNYEGGEVKGVVETPFNNLADELQTQIEPEITDTVDRIAWLLNDADMWVEEMKDPNNTPYHFEKDPNIIVDIYPDPNDSASFSFTVQEDGNIIDSGSVNINDPNMPTSGTFEAEFKTQSGNKITTTLTYAGTVDPNDVDVYKSITFTGTIEDPNRFSIDFSQGTRKLSANFAKTDDPTDDDDIYPTSIYLESRITTNTARMDGLFNISSIVCSTEECKEGLRPEEATFVGTFAELSNGLTTGVEFTGTITGEWSNADTYDECLEDSNSNFVEASATFNGTIESPAMPTLNVVLSAAQTEYKKGTMSVNFRKAGVSFLSGSGTLDDTSDDSLMTICLTSQTGLKINITIDESNEGEEMSGTMETSGGDEVAEIYTVNGLPMIRYADGYIESLI